MSEPDHSWQEPLAKALLSTEELVSHLKSRGVTFDLYTEADAVTYLANANNYLRAASYRKLFPVHNEGPHVGDFVHLDFAYLVELSSIDRMLRETLLALTIDIEHFAKIHLLGLIESRGEDGFEISAEFLAMRPRTERSLEARSETGERHDTYSGDLIAHYRGHMPAWVMLEVIDFGTFVDFWLFCAERWKDDGMRQRHYILKSVKALRNACAHNNLLVHGLSIQNAPADFPTNRLLSDSLNEHGMKNTKTRRAKLKNLRIAQMAATLWSLDEFCKRPSTRSRHSKRLQVIRTRVESAQFAQSPSAGANRAILSFFDFLWKLVDIWGPMQAE